MTQDEITRMAMEAGLFNEDANYQYMESYVGSVERFAALVAAHAKQEYIDSVYDLHRETMMTNKDFGMLVDAVKAEREACAKVCDHMADMNKKLSDSARPDHCAVAIRARGEK